MKPLCDSLFECNLDASAIYCNLTAFWKKGIRVKGGDQKILSIHQNDDDDGDDDHEDILGKRIQVMSHIQQIKHKLLSLDSVSSICLMDILSIYQQDIDLMMEVTKKYTIYYGLHHPRVALKLYEVAMLSNDCHLRHKLLTQARNIYIISSSPSLVSLLDSAIKETQEQLKVQVKVKNSKCKWVPTNNWNGQVIQNHRNFTLGTRKGYNNIEFYTRNKGRHF